jgi:hypothetical protein
LIYFRPLLGGISAVAGTFRVRDTDASSLQHKHADIKGLKPMGCVGGYTKQVNPCSICCFTKLNCFMRVMSIIYQQNWVPCCIPCHGLGYETFLKPLGANIIAGPTFLGQCNAANTVSVVHPCSIRLLTYRIPCSSKYSS